MLVTKTIRIDDKLHKDAIDHIKRLGTSGGFSGYIQSLVASDLKKKESKVKRATVIDDKQYNQLIAEIKKLKALGRNELVINEPVQGLIMQNLADMGYQCEEIYDPSKEPISYTSTIKWNNK